MLNVLNSLDLEIYIQYLFQDISLQNDELKQVGGGLTELNTILSGTQKKLNKIKVSINKSNNEVFIRVMYH